MSCGSRLKIGLVRGALREADGLAHGDVEKLGHIEVLRESVIVKKFGGLR